MIHAQRLSDLVEFIRTQDKALTAQLMGEDVSFCAVSTDTRSLQQGELFVALRGERFDAHDFMADAIAKNPCALLVEKYFPEFAIPQLVVTDSLLALGQIAALNRNQFSGKLVAITGSSGKTTVKTMLAAILSEMGSTHATRGNFNNHIGVPLTLLQLTAGHRFAVIEMGASAIGEIAYLCELARPDVSMINNVMPAHIEGFGSIEGVAQAKGEIYLALRAGANAVVNIDDKFASDWLKTLVEQHVLRVSLNDVNADVFLRGWQQLDEGLAFDFCVNGEMISAEINALGEHSLRNALMAAACATVLGAKAHHIQQGLKNFAPVVGRMNRKRGLNGALVIDDSYNANPGSVRAAIDVLKQTEESILVLGDLGELGANAINLHAELGEYARLNNIRYLFTLGQLTRHSADAFGTGAQHFTDRAELMAALKAVAKASATFLIKGSRSANMDLVVNELCNLTGENH